MTGQAFGLPCCICEIDSGKIRTESCREGNVLLYL